jgi:hypothetical protein
MRHEDTPISSLPGHWTSSQYSLFNIHKGGRFDMVLQLPITHDRGINPITAGEK